MIYELTKEHLTEDDIKVIKHLKAIDNLFKKGNFSICGLFATPDGRFIRRKLIYGIVFD